MNKCKCLICNNEFESFRELPTANRKCCPFCYSLERHRLMWDFLNKKTDFFNLKQKIMLHVAPEKHLYDVISKMKNINYITCDLNPDVYKFSDKIKKINLTNIPFEDNYFDNIICSHVLEHIDDDISAMKELYRVLSPSGWAILQVPIRYNINTYENFSITDPVERLKEFGQSDHVRWYGRDYVDRLKNSGFNVVEDDYVYTLSKNDIERFGFTKTEIVYFCTKK